MNLHFHLQLWTILLLPIIVLTDTDGKTCQPIVVNPESVILNCSYTPLIDLSLQDHSDISRTTVLDFSHKDLNHLPEVLNPTTFPNLVHLNVSHNQIEDIGKKMKQFSKLQHVDLSFNQLNDVARLVCPSDTVILSLQNNLLTILELDTSCIYLTKLYLQNNQISDIATNNVHVHNKPNFELEIIDLSGNKLTVVKEHHLTSFKDLQELYLANNSITEIEANSFSLLSYLERIDLSHNRLKVLPQTLFVKNEYLKFLDVSYNQLQTLSSQFPMLEWIDVSFNRISVIQEDLRSVLYPVRVFLIGGNPFKCTCDMLWLKELFDVRKYLLEYLTLIDSSKFIPICDEPVKLKGKFWDDLKDDTFECFGLVEEDLKLTNEKVATVLNDGNLLKATAINESSINVKWNIIANVEIHSMEISYHPFGKKRDGLKTFKLSPKTTSHLIRDLEANTPYVVCITVKFETPLTDCIEVITDKEPVAGILYVMGSIWSLVQSRLDLVAITIGLLTLIYIIYILVS